MKRLLLILALALPASGSGQWVTPTESPSIACPCYEASNLIDTWDDCSGTTSKSVDASPPTGFTLVTCDTGAPFTSWLSVNDDDSCEVTTSTVFPGLVVGELAASPDQATSCYAASAEFDTARP